MVCSEYRLWVSLRLFHDSLIFLHDTDDFLIGTAAEVFMLRSATNIFPTDIMMKGQFYFIGRIVQLLEVQCFTSKI